MDKVQIKTVLRNRENELRPLGIVHLHLHGSQVSGHARPDSDIDLAASFDRAKVRTALDEIALRNRMSEILGAAVDLCDAERLEAEGAGLFSARGRAYLLRTPRCRCGTSYGPSNGLSSMSAAWTSRLTGMIRKQLTR